GWLFRGEGGPWFKAQWRSRLRLDSAEAIRDAALAGLGIALLPDFLVADEDQAVVGCEIVDVARLTALGEIGRRGAEPRLIGGD
ncbi:LysR substrate-binding domain-containing protein, partial [Rhizobium ruizarguesonis]